MQFSQTGEIRKRDNDKHKGAWYFFSFSKEISQQINELTTDRPRKGFGSIRVEADVAFSKRKTSVFPESKSGCYILAIKKQIRNELSIGEGDTISVSIRIL